MANEITLGYISGRTLTYGVYQPKGTVRTAAGTSLPEEGATGYYHASDGNIQAGDIVVVIDGATFVCAQGEYKPEVSASDIESKIDTIDTNVDTLITAQQTVKTDDPVPEPVETRKRIYY